MKWIQLWIAPKISALVLLKSMTLVRDFGRGLPHVKNFFDTVQSASQVLDEGEGRRELAVVRRQASGPPDGLCDQADRAHRKIVRGRAAPGLLAKRRGALAQPRLAFAGVCHRNRADRRDAAGVMASCRGWTRAVREDVSEMEHGVFAA